MAARRSKPLTIHEAVLRNALGRLRRIIRQNDPSTINVQDKSHGATPLMLAALIGSVKLVKYLLRRGASWDVKDYHGKVASEYADGNYSRMMRQLYRRTVTPEKATILGQLHRHLNAYTTLEMQYRTTPAGTLAFDRHNKSLRLYKLIGKVNLPAPAKKNSTSACICPGDTVKPEICAISGWSDITTLGLLNGSKYVPLVRQMADIMGFELPGSCYDNPKSEPNPGPHNTGRVKASHCEKLLGAYWVEQELIRHFGSADLSRMGELKAIDLPNAREHAVIFLDHQPCLSCLSFLAAIQEATGIKITALRQAAVRKTSRKVKLVPGFCLKCTCDSCIKADKTRSKGQHQNTVDQQQETQTEDEVQTTGNSITLVEKGWKEYKGGQVVCHKPPAAPEYESPTERATGSTQKGEMTPPPPAPLGLAIPDGLPTFSPSPIRHAEVPSPEEGPVFPAQVSASPTTASFDNGSPLVIHDPSSYQAGRSAFFQTPLPSQRRASKDLEVILRSQPQDRSLIYRRVELSPSEGSQRSIISINSSRPPTPEPIKQPSLITIQQRQQRRRKLRADKRKKVQERMQEVAKRLNLRERFTFPGPSRQPAHTAKPTTGHSSKQRGLPAWASRAPRERKLAERSTLLANAQYRDQVIKQVYPSATVEDAARKHDREISPAAEQHDGDNGFNLLSQEPLGDRQSQPYNLHQAAIVDNMLDPRPCL